MSLPILENARTRALGFNLIEVMVSVVILATGLLALTALQGRLAQNSADSKARSAIMAALSSRMSELRQSPAADGTTTIACAADNWVCAAQTQAGAGALTVSQTIATLLWKGGAFQIPVAGDDLSGSNLKRIALSASWTDATGASRVLTLRSDVSNRIYGAGGGYPIPDPNSSAFKKPIVRRSNPELEAGVIPIAYGTGEGAQSTAASNPKPIKIGSANVVGTQFDVLTYTPEGGTDSAIVRRRIDTNLVKCTCSTGLADGDRYSVAGKAQWPTVWNGYSYQTYAPSGGGDAPGESLKAGELGGNEPKSRTQSPLCTECCRDHHDTNAMTVRYSPEGETDRYNLSGGSLSVSTSGAFVAACRVIKNDGIYKTAADMYLRQFGLLQTRSDPADSTLARDLAKNGTPMKTATDSYGGFVKSYLTGYFTSIASSGSAPTTPAQAQQAFDDWQGGALNAPSNVEIPVKGAGDVRYLHARGLYVDYLTQEARTAITAACGGGTDLNCLLPRLAFTTINLTELAKWSASDAKLNVTASGTLLSPVPTPSGGATYGLDATASSRSKATASLSNSTVAFRSDIPFTTASEADSSTWLADNQQFSVGGTGSGGGELPYIDVFTSGFLSAYSNVSNVTLSMSVAGGSPTSCSPDVATNSYRCYGSAPGVLPASIGLVASNYNYEENKTGEAINVKCGNKTSSQPRPYTITYSSLAVSQTLGGTSVGSVTTNPSVQRSIPQLATWGSLVLSDKGSLYLNLSGGERRCPEAAVCGTGNKFLGWGTTYSVVGCSKTSY